MLLPEDTPRKNRELIYMAACTIAGIRLARESQINPRVIPTADAIEQCAVLAIELFQQIFGHAPDVIDETIQLMEADHAIGSRPCS
jgi:hypothetical protein